MLVSSPIIDAVVGLTTRAAPSTAASVISAIVTGGPTPGFDDAP